MHACTHAHTSAGFTAARDGAKLRAELSHNLTRATAWEAVMRVRCSRGLRISSFHGHFFNRYAQKLPNSARMFVGATQYPSSTSFPHPGSLALGLAHVLAPSRHVLLYESTYFLALPNILAAHPLATQERVHRSAGAAHV
eukprot:scaffold222004_cov17-Tisochrysis_lutea.AAC.1